MRALQEAVCLVPPALFAGPADIHQPFNTTLVAATSSAQFTLASPGWWTFQNTGTTNPLSIGFFTISGAAANASASDFVLQPGASKDWYIDQSPVLASNPGTAFIYFKAFSTAGTTLQWVKSS